eukprot:10257862-Alexandrium_andersonii.AAC.1
MDWGDDPAVKEAMRTGPRPHGQHGISKEAKAKVWAQRAAKKQFARTAHRLMQEASEEQGGQQ